MGGEEGGGSRPGHVCTTSVKGICSQANILVPYMGLHVRKGFACLYGNVCHSRSTQPSSQSTSTIQADWKAPRRTLENGKPEKHFFVWTCIDA